MWSRIVAAADRTGARSGSLVVVIGVGTQTKIASASEILASAGATTRSPSPSAAWSLASSMSSIGDEPAFSSATRLGQGVDAFDVEAGLDERDGQGQTNVAEADHGHSTVFAHSSSQVRSSRR